MCTGKKTVALFVDSDVFGVLILNGIVKGLIRQGYIPVIFDSKETRNITPIVSAPSISKLLNNKVLEDVVIPFIDSSNNSKYLKALSPRELAKKYEVQYFEIGDPDNQGVLQSLDGLQNFAGAISQRISQVFAKETVDFVKERGFFWNMHSGLLPHYMGLLTIYHAIKDKASDYGMTLHDVSYEIDRGDIIEQTKHKLNPSKPVFELYLDTVQSGVDMILKNTALMIKEGSVPMRQQNKLEAKYFQNLTAEEFKQAALNGVTYANIKKIPQLIASQFVEGNSIAGQQLETEIRAYIESYKTTQDPANENTSLAPAANIPPPGGRHFG